MVNEYLSELIRRDNEIAFFKTKAEQERKEKEKAMLKEKEAKEKEKETNIKLAIKMLKYGESIPEIIKETGLNKEQIKELK